MIKNLNFNASRKWFILLFSELKVILNCAQYKNLVIVEIPIKFEAENGTRKMQLKMKYVINGRSSWNSPIHVRELFFVVVFCNLLTINYNYSLQNLESRFELFW